MSNLKLYVGNDLVIKLSALTNVETGAFINAAAVSVTLSDRIGVEVPGETWPLALAYVTGSDGIYRATLKDTLDIIVGKTYTAEIIADGGDGLRGKWTEYVPAEVRPF